MPRRLNDSIDVKQAVANSAGQVGAFVGTAIPATGFGRARFVFSFGANAGTSAALSSGLGIYQASTSGATFALIAGAILAAVSSGVLSANVMVIDVPTSSGTPWLKVSGGSMLSTAIAHSAIVELYSGVNRPPVSSAQQVVVV